MLPRVPVCPAAAPIAGAVPEAAGVVCRIMKREYEQTPHDGMNAAQYGFTTREATGGILLTLKSDPSTVIRFCHGNAVPVLTNEDGLSRDSYTYCPVWQADRDAKLEGRKRATIDEEPEPVSMGMPGAEHSLEASDPWGQARHDLDLLRGEAEAYVQRTHPH